MLRGTEGVRGTEGGISSPLGTLCLQGLADLERLGATLHSATRDSPHTLHTPEGSACVASQQPRRNDGSARPPKVRVELPRVNPPL